MTKKTENIRTSGRTNDHKSTKASTLKQLNRNLKLNLPKELLNTLYERDIRRLADIRRSGGISHLENLPVAADHPVVRTLEAHAYLGLVSDNHKANKKLINAGFHSIADIARTTRKSFVKKAKEAGIKEDVAFTMYAKATAQSAFFNNVFIGFRADRANNFDILGPTPGPIAPFVDLPFPRECGCMECESAVSPLAYLADLLDYTITHVKHNDGSINLSFLESKFHQPFGRLPASCEEMEKQVRQVRICIEVLRSYLKTIRLTEEQKSDLAEAEAEYLLAAYDVFLNQIGTSYEEIRLVRTMDEEKRKGLADRLSIHVDHLDNLFLNPETDSEQDSMTERNLEKLFGLTDTTRNPLSDGATLNDQRGQITCWNLNGLQWNRNTDSDGTIYVTLRKSSSVFRVELYRDRERRELVASGERSSAVGTVELREKNDSGLTGSFDIAYRARDNDIEISAISNFLSWRLQHLRTLWKEQDWRVEYPEDRVIIDPDVIHRDYDFRKPPYVHVPHISPRVSQEWRIWGERRRWVDETFSERERILSEEGLNSALENVFGEPLPDFNELYENLNKGDNIEDTKKVITEELRFSLESFRRLVEIRKKADEASEEVAESEWKEICAILNQVEKVKKLHEWIEKERRRNITLGPHDFWISIEEPELKPWLASPEARQAWKQALRMRGQPPLIDPDIIVFSDLKDPIGGNPAYDILDKREKDTEKKIKELKRRTRDQEGFKTSWIEIVGASWEEFERLSQERSEGEDIEAKRERLSLTTAAFDRLVSLYELLETGNILDSEWDEAYSILVQVWKRRQFALWRDEERAEGIILSPDIFRIAKVDEEPEELEQWRASRGARRDWQDGLSASIGQEKAVIGALNQALDACEGATLALLRDALIMASDAEGSDITTRAKSLTDKLLIDCQIDVCQKTTRVAQAIVTLQNLLFSLRTGQFDDSVFVLDAENFDEEWEWIGSYETWKAAVFVFIYPENILLPSLRHRQTPAFKELIAKLRRDRRLTPDKARDQVKEYEAYFKDICSLRLETAVWTTSPTRIYIIVKGGFTKSFYMSSYDPDDASDYTQTFWEKITELETVQVIDVVGAVPYRFDKENYIYLFVKIRTEGADKLIFITHDLNTGLWVQPNELELPEETTTFSAVVKQRQRDDEPPHVAVLANNKLYARKIKANGWEDGEWEENFIIEHSDWLGECDLLEMFWYKWSQFVVVLRREGEGIIFKKFIKYAYERDGEWRKLTSVGRWVGSLRWWIGGKVILHLFWEHNSTTYYKEITEMEDNTFNISGDKLFDIKISRIASHNSYSRDTDEIMQVIYTLRDKILGSELKTLYRSVFKLGNTTSLERLESKLIAPFLRKYMDLSLKLEPAYPNEIRRTVTEKLFKWHLERDAPEAVLTYLQEAFYFVPMAIALQLQRARQYTAALDWFRSVYDYTKPLEDRKIYYGLELEEDEEYGYERYDDWLLDPLNPHAVAETRRSTYTRFTLLSIIRCFLDYADAEFTRDTAESLPRARTLYETALELLELPELNQYLDLCTDIIGYLEMELRDSRWEGVWRGILNDMAGIDSVAVLERTVDELRTIIRDSRPLPVRLTEARKTVNEAIIKRKAMIGNIVDMRKRAVTDIHRLLLEDESMERSVELMTPPKTVYGVPATPEAEVKTHPPAVVGYIPTVSTFEFCIPPNPMIWALRLHVENSLHKLRTCRNIAGVKREIELYAAPVDVISGMPAIGAGGQLIVPTRITPPPVPYRYEFLIERTKQLVNIAAQVEAAFLSALEKRDIEYYNLLKARQDIRLARAGVRLQDLQFHQAQDEVKLAELQRESAQIQAQTYQEWIEAGLNEYEMEMIDAYQEIASIKTLSAYWDVALQSFQALTTAATAGFGAAAAFASAASVAMVALQRAKISELIFEAEKTAQVAFVYANYERRAQEWQLQKDLAEHSIRIGDQQINITEDGVRIAAQERNIAKMQVEHAESTVEFLDNKFTNVELYDWMSDVLEGVYSYFIQEATAMAKLAQNQLAFERQEPPPAVILDDYWEVPSENLLGGATEDAVDRYGLTGSARLMADIYRLDQYRLETEKRKLQLTKNISLARMCPYEFQLFKETGVIVFDTSMELFDRDFPGHHLRMIKRVRTSVIALIPPTQGIKATFSNTGISRIVVSNNSLFQTITAHRPPESVALTSPSSATGYFELESRSEMLLPFEGLGTDTVWEFRMPKAANRFDYRTIADIIISIEYTALDSSDYRQQVIETLPSTISAERPFSFRHQFADQWYDLHNPEQTATPMCVRLRTRREDFPPNIENLKIEHVVLYFAGAEEESREIEVTLHFRPEGGMADIGGEATSIDSVISTRRSNAGSWTLMIGKSPVGEWVLALPNTEEMKNRFKSEEIENILFVVTYSGRTPEWPE